MAAVGRAKQGRAGLFLSVCRAQADQEQEPVHLGLFQNTSGEKQLLLDMAVSPPMLSPLTPNWIYNRFSQLLNIFWPGLNLAFNPLR